MRFDGYGILIVTFAILMIATVGLLLCIMSEKVCEFFYRKTLRYTTFLDNAVVSDKQYRKSHTSHSTTKIGKVFLPRVVHHPATYKVYLRYKGKEYLIDNQALYNRVKINDRIGVYVHDGMNKKREVKHRYLSV